VTLLANPPDSGAVLGNGRVLINPILSGSGVNIKSIEMLLVGAPVVTTSIGVRGLPEKVRAQYKVADTPADFAAHIIAALSEPVTGVTETASATFGPAAIIDQIAIIEACLRRA